MNNKIFKILICCIMILLLFSNSTLVQSITDDNIQFTVSDNYQLKNAIEQANDNDIIGITDSISAAELSIIGTNEKHITLKRMNANAFIYLGTGSYTITNITFDGNNIPSSYSFIESSQNTTIYNCTFKNCNSTWEGGCINATDKNLYITNCDFTNNKAIYGGHIACNGGEYIEILNSSLSNGSAQIDGAVYSNSNVTIENTKFYNNTASTGGSDIYCIGNLNLKDSIEDLQKLFPDSELKPIAWVSDYNDDNSYLKLEFGKIEEENSSDNNTTDETEKNPNEDNTKNTETTNQDNKDNENTGTNQQNENNNNESSSQNPSNEEKENNKSEQNHENISASTSNENINNENVTNNSHNTENGDTSNFNTNFEELSFIQKIITKITEIFNIKNAPTQQITDDSSKIITNNNASPVNLKIYISTSPTNKTEGQNETVIPNKAEITNPSNQSFNFSFNFKNDNNDNLLIIFIFVQLIMITAVFIVLLMQYKRNNGNHYYFMYAPLLQPFPRLRSHHLLCSLQPHLNQYCC